MLLSSPLLLPLRHLQVCHHLCFYGENLSQANPSFPFLNMSLEVLALPVV